MTSAAPTPLPESGRRAQRLPPHQPAARDHQHDRPHDGVGEPNAERAHGQQHAEGQQPDAEGDLDRRAAATHARPRRGLARVVGGDEDPRRGVEQEPDAARRGRRHERDPHHQRVDAEVAAQAGAHAADVLVGAVATQRLAGRGRGAGGGHVACDHPSRGRRVSRGA
jgi:hypothetical protein